MNRLSCQKLDLGLRCLLTILAVVASFSKVRGAETQVQFAEGVLHLKTARWEIDWQNGSLTHLKTLLPKPIELTIGNSITVSDLPNGLGSFNGHQQEGWAQHHPWGNVQAPYRAQHVPGTTTKVTFDRLPDGARLTYQNLVEAPDAVLVQELTVDPKTGDLVVRQRGQMKEPGVFGVTFSLLNLRNDLELIVPYFGGQRFTPEQGKGAPFSLAWPAFWSAALIIGEIPASAGSGTFAVWAQDPSFRPKYFRRLRTDASQALNFESCGDAPYAQTTDVQSVEWRMNTFAGTWTEPAARYKQWVQDGYAMPSRTTPAPKKIADNIALLWPAPLDEPSMKKMAARIDPKRVLMMDWGMLSGFNRKIPDYTPQDPKYAERVAVAHRYGYRVGCYTSMSLVDQETHPNIIRDYGLSVYYNALAEHDPATVLHPKDWLVYVHPGSAKWRQFYADTMRRLHETVGIDYFYEDVAGCQQGSAGLIDGRTFSKGVVDAFTDIRAATPGVALGGEYWNEVTAARADFGLGTFLAWGDDAHRAMLTRPDGPHPILSYLFSDSCAYWPHQIQIRDTKKWHLDQNINEVIGAMPTWEGEVDDIGSEANVVLEQAKMRIEGFRPDFPAQWETGVVSYLRSPDGRTLRYVRDGQSTFCLERTQSGDSLRYGRLFGRTSYQGKEPTHIDGWVAYGDRGPIGLDPQKWYCLFPGAPEEKSLPIRVTSLPAGVSVQGVRSSADYALIQFSGTAGGEAKWQVTRKPSAIFAGAKPLPADATAASLEASSALLFTWAAPVKVVTAAPVSLHDWQFHITSAGQVIRPGQLSEQREFELAGETHPGVRISPPTGGAGSEISIDRLVELPDESNLSLSVQTGLLGGSGDGVHFVVRVNGQEIAPTSGDERRMERVDRSAEGLRRTNGRPKFCRRLRPLRL